MVRGASVRWSRYVIYGLLLFFAAIYVLPLVVMLLTSLKPLQEIYSGSIIALPHEWTVKPWIDAWGQICVGLSCHGIKGYFWNSVKITVPAVLISPFIDAMNGYVLLI